MERRRSESKRYPHIRAGSIVMLACAVLWVGCAGVRHPATSASSTVSNAWAVGQAEGANATPLRVGSAPAPRVVTIPPGGRYDFMPPVVDNQPYHRCCVLAVYNDSPLAATVTKNGEQSVALPSGNAVLVEGGGRDCVLDSGHANVVRCSDVNQESSIFSFTAVPEIGLPPPVTTVSYPAGWNLVTLPNWQVLKGIVDRFWDAAYSSAASQMVHAVYVATSRFGWSQHQRRGPSARQP